MPTDLAAQPWTVWLTLGGGLVATAAFLATGGNGRSTGTDQRQITAERDSLLQENREMRLTEQRLRSILDATTEGFVMMNMASKTISEVNPAFCSMLGFSRSELINRCPAAALGVDGFHVCAKTQDCKRRDLFFATISHKTEWRLKTKQGSTIHAQLNATTVHDEFGVPNLCFAFISDMSDRKKYEDDLYRQAHYDPVTGLPNRHYLIKHVNALIEQQKPFGLLLLDMDDFKLYNDTLGHDRGDILLKRIASRLKASAPDSAFTSRLGGDEFAIICTPDEVAKISQSCFAMLTEPISAGKNELYISASAGTVVYPDDASNVSHLLRRADLALQRAKAVGRGSVITYKATLDKNLENRLEMGNRLRKALERNEFSLVFQPQIDTTTNSIVGVEALLRWNSQDQNHVGPDVFIPILEETGLIVPVGKWVLQTACTKILPWHWAGYPIRLSVNLSPRQFRDRNLVDTISQTLHDTGFNPAFLCLEITESLLIDDVAKVTRKLETLAQRGILFSIDDFGTGYSSLSYLQRLPIHELKIDRTFVNNIPANTGNLVIIQTVVAMASSLGIKTVAEGVETKEQLQAIRDTGVDAVQGYYYSRPVSDADIYRMITKTNEANRDGAR